MRRYMVVDVEYEIPKEYIEEGFGDLSDYGNGIKADISQIPGVRNVTLIDEGEAIADDPTT